MARIAKGNMLCYLKLFIRFKKVITKSFRDTEFSDVKLLNKKNTYIRFLVTTLEHSLSGLKRQALGPRCQQWRLGGWKGRIPAQKRSLENGLSLGARTRDAP